MSVNALLLRFTLASEFFGATKDEGRGFLRVQARSFPTDARRDAKHSSRSGHAGSTTNDSRHHRCGTAPDSHRTFPLFQSRHDSEISNDSERIAHRRGLGFGFPTRPTPSPTDSDPSDKSDKSALAARANNKRPACASHASH